VVVVMKLFYIFMICVLSGRVVIGLFGKAVPKTAGMIVLLSNLKH
jgi:hypothetical protein